MADEKDISQNAADGAADKPAKPARAPRKTATKPAADKPAAARGKPAAKAEVESESGSGAQAPEAEAAKPARRRARAAAEPPAETADTTAAEAATGDAAAETEATSETAEAPAAGRKPARKRAAAPKARAAAGKAAAPAVKPARAPAAEQPAEQPAVRRAPDQRVAVVVDAAGKQVEEIKLSPERFGLAADLNLLHLTVRAEQAARRRGTASTRTRGEISGSTAKLYRQKGTGRARAGSVKSPTRSGGGTAFGPKPRSYEIKVNRKAARKALAMALSDRAEGGTIYVARGLELDEPSTATVNELLVTMDIAAPVLFVTDDEPVVARSVRNLWFAESGEARRLSVEQVLRNRSIVVTEKALSVLTGA